MKRIFVLFLAFAVLMTAAAIAEEPVFQLDNGLRWGMNQDDIFALLGEENALAEPMFEGVDTIQYVLDNDIPDDDCSVSLSMVLVDGELAMIMYDIQRVEDPAVKESCIADMTALFGEPIEGGMDRFMSSFGLLAGLPELTAADLGAPGTGVSWELADGTYMGVYDLSDISFGVYFVNEPRFAAVADHLNSYYIDVGISLPDVDTPPQMAVDFSLTVPGILHSSFDDIHSSVKLPDNDIAVINGAPDGPDVISVFPNYGSPEVCMNYMFDTRGLLVVTYGMTSPGYVGDLFTDMGAEFEAVYGPASTPDDHTHYIMNMVTSGNYESAAQDDILSWMLEDGTAVMLIPVTEIENSAAVIYIAKDMLEQ